MRTVRALRLAAGLAILAAPHLGSAQQPAYPAKTIRLIASQSPGGGIDAVARIVATRLADALGQSVIVDNRPGANGSVAGELAAKAPADGYTMMLGAVGNLAVNVLFYRHLGYEPLRDLLPVTTVISSGNVLVIHPSVPANSVKSLIALAKAHPGELALGTSGTGGAGHLAGSLLQSMARIKLLHVPYKGGGPAMVDLLAGQVQLAFASSVTALPNIRSGRLRALAVTTARRSKILPDLPTMAEAGVPGYESHSWYGFAVPARTPAAIVTRLHREIAQIVNRPDVSAVLLKLGLEPWTLPPEEFGAYVRSEFDKWGRIIRAAGITPN